ncbi:hypothetical protein ACFLZB_05005 [Nanoarchaeota archaeon]
MAFVDWQDKQYNIPLGPTKDCLSLNEMSAFWLGETSPGLQKIIQDHTQECRDCKNHLSQRKFNLKKTAEYLGGSVYNE